MQTTRTLTTAMVTVVSLATSLVATAYAAPLVPAFYLVGGPAAGPDRELCRRASGTLLVRTRCNAGEEVLSPTALVVCRRKSGGATLRGIECSVGETRTDLREMRGMSPASILGTPTAKSKAGVTKARLLDDFKTKNLGAAPLGFCRDLGTGVTVRAQCALAEIPLAVADLETCLTPGGVLELRASYCGKREEGLDLRSLLGPVDRVGIGPLVGLLPRVADIPAEYGQ